MALEELGGSRLVQPNRLYVSLDDQKEMSLCSRPHETMHLYFGVPMAVDVPGSDMLYAGGTDESEPSQPQHWAVVKLKLAPFYPPEHVGQTLIAGEGFYQMCCELASRDGLVPPRVCHIAQEVHRRVLCCPQWDFSVEECWRQMCPSELGSSSPLAPGSCRSAVTHKLRALIQHPESESELIPTPTSTPTSMSPSSSCTTSSSASFKIHQCAETALPTAVTTTVHTLLASPQSNSPKETQTARRRSKITSAIGPDHIPLVNVTDNLIIAIKNAKPLSPTATKDAFAVLQSLNMDEANENDTISEVWRVCKVTASSCQYQFQSSLFSRFLSLCFFLIWEKCSQKSGTGAARHTNLKMREAGFQGTSRSLKSMREETILINRLVATLQAAWGSDDALLLYNVLFESSKYHAIRMINRLGTRKKHTIIAYIVTNLSSEDLTAKFADPFPIHDDIRRYLPRLEKHVILDAINFKPLDNSPQPKPTIALGGRATDWRDVAIIELPNSPGMTPGTTISSERLALNTSQGDVTHDFDRMSSTERRVHTVHSDRVNEFENTTLQRATDVSLQSLMPLEGDTMAVDNTDPFLVDYEYDYDLATYDNLDLDELLPKEANPPLAQEIHSDFWC